METLLTVDDVAEHCHVHRRTVERAIHAGRLRAAQLGQRGAYRLRESDVEAWLEASVVRPKSSALPDPRPARAARGTLTVRDGMGRAA